MQSAIAIALGTLCSAGSPCCSDRPPVERVVGTVPLREADGGAVEADADAAAPITYEQCKASCALAHSGAVTCRRVSDQGDGTPRVECVTVESYCSQSAGRRHAQARTRRRDRGLPSAAAHLAETAALEAISVHAFELLARDLRHHRAPPTLIAAAERAKRDEIRHARSMRAIAEAQGARVRTVTTPTWRPRPLFRIAKENVVEGCVREAFGALLATHQAAFATGASLRRAMERIAIDEARHAALASAVHEWMSTKLTPAQNARLENAERRAWEELGSARFDAAVAVELGLPRGDALRGLVATFRATLARSSLSAASSSARRSTRRRPR